MNRNKNKNKKETATSHQESVRKMNVSGYDEFQRVIKELLTGKEKPQINILFTGEKNSVGASWCPDCNHADPYIQKALADYARKDSVFLEVDVGDRDTYKNRENPFRLDNDTKVHEIPTLLRWKTVIRLDGGKCANPGLLEMFFAEPDEED